MDEPFSAVDPVVRGDLQTEVRRLQEELHKTILFVTHDIDEATILGDSIAVFGPGGVLHQHADPATILNAPASSYVTSLVGRDRGYRSLSFATADTLPVRPVEDPIALERMDDAVVEPGRWRLVLDGAVPIGWLDHAGVAAIGRGRAVRDVVRVGSLAHPGGTLRQALDAALSSPSGLGLVVDDDGAVLGTVTAEDVLSRLHELRADEASGDGP